MKITTGMIAGLLLTINLAYGQTNKNKLPKFVEPTFPGGKEAWDAYLIKNVHYPMLARQVNINGRVIVEFDVQKDGSIANVKINKGLGAGCDEEALRAVKASPRWNPAYYKGKAVPYTFTLPVRFQLTNTTDETTH